MVAQAGLEPATHEFSIHCSTIGAIVPLFGVLWGIEPSRSDSQSDMRPLHQQHHIETHSWNVVKPSMAPGAIMYLNAFLYGLYHLTSP